jgi:phosphate acetyltransferase
MAARELAENRLCHPVLIGQPELINPYLEGLEGSFTVVQYDSSYKNAVEQIAAMAFRKEVDAVIAGATQESAVVFRAALRECNPQKTRLTSTMLFLEDGREPFFIADPAIDFVSTPENVARAAFQTYEFMVKIGVTPSMALLAPATRKTDSPRKYKDKTAQLMADALELLREKLPEDAMVDGPLQYDAAMRPDVRLLKGLTDCVLTQPTNAVFYPTYGEGNGAYKQYEYLTESHALGPIVHGCTDQGGEPILFSDVSRGVTIPALVALAELLCR